MKSFRTALFAAAVTAGIPALAMAQDAPQDQRESHHDHGGDRGDRGPRPDGAPRPDGGGRPDRGTQPAPQPQAQAQPQIHAQDVQRQPTSQVATGRGNFEGGRPYGRFAPGQQPGDNTDARGQARDGRRDDRRAPGFAPGRLDNGRPDGVRPDDGRRDNRDGRPGFDRANGNWQRPDAGHFDNGRPGYDRGNGNWQHPGGNYGRPDGNFNRPNGGNWRGPDWRQDRRYDWRGYRDQNRNLFRGPRYVAPRSWGYGYRRFDVGYRLPPFLFGQEYWIADPWVYRLPPVDGPYRWVRYYNDVLLIDLRSGEVVDSIPDFFF